MKKLILLTIMVIGILSCQDNSPANVEKLNELTYFKDGRTGLCFAAINSLTYGGGKVTSITCVPCDSLKNVEVKVIY